ncbi:MAG: hypothetical protein P8P74_04870 [Crocinitomicaceae bacterium]|nr:hypothetical protein [Crocinitomicaceae bacterium]
MNRRIFTLLLVPILLLACSEEKRRLFRQGKKISNDFVLEMQHFFSESEDNMSFPVWFDDSLIKQNNVKSIHRKVFNLNGKVDDFASLKAEKRYSFDEKGRITSVQISEYYEGQMISDVTFSYSGVKDIYGFQKVKMEKTNVSDIELTGYQLYETEQTASNFMAYVNVENGDYLFFLPNKKHWGALSVDSILSPTSEDLVVYGTPRTPSKRYHVVNRVNEFNVRTVEYANKTTNPTEIQFEREPFDYKRTIEYNKKGACTGFIDSTFSMDNYIMRRQSKFTFENNQLPIRVTHMSAPSNENEKNVQIETFDYTYYD